MNSPSYNKNKIQARLLAYNWTFNNIGLLFSVDPEIPSYLKPVMMCGYYERKNKEAYPMEWNAFGDYHATKIVFDAGVPMLGAVGLDVTTQVRMSAAEVKSKFNHELLLPVVDFATVWFETFYEYITFHDPLAAVSIFNKDVCTFTKGNVEIEIEDKDRLGLTKWQPCENGKHEVVLSVDKHLSLRNISMYLNNKKYQDENSIACVAGRLAFIFLSCSKKNDEQGITLTFCNRKICLPGYYRTFRSMEFVNPFRYFLIGGVFKKDKFIFAADFFCFIISKIVVRHNFNSGKIGILFVKICNSV